MFQIGDQVLYGIHGVCKIVDIECKKLNGKQTEYFVLEPLDQKQSKYFIPTQNQAAVAKLQPVLSLEELTATLHCAAPGNDLWIEDENKRKQRYGVLMTGGDRAAVVKMAKTIRAQKLQKESAGKKLHQCDEQFLRDAQKLLGTEFSLVLNIPYEEAGKYIQNILNEEKTGGTSI